MKKIRIVIILLVLPLAIWILDLGRCELLSHRHGSELRPALEEYIGESEIRQLKVLGYSREKKARVYMVNFYPDEDYPGGGFEEGWVYRLEWTGGEWMVTVAGEQGWSGAGSADDGVWPYKLPG